MEELRIGQCGGKCDDCDIQDCHFQGVTKQRGLDIATDRLIERMIREDEGEQL